MSNMTITFEKLHILYVIHRGLTNFLSIQNPMRAWNIMKFNTVSFSASAFTIVKVVIVFNFVMIDQGKCLCISVDNLRIKY